MGEKPRRFTEKQAAEILKRAAAAPETGTQPEGISENELLTVGRELGLSDQQIRSAMVAYDEGAETNPQERWLGAPPSYEMERLVSGPLTDEAWQAMVAELNTTFGQALPGETNGPARSWQFKHSLGYVNVLASPAGKDTRIRLVAYIDDGLSVWLMSVIGLCVTATASLGAVKPFWLGLLFAPIFVVLVFSLLRGGVKSWYKQDKKKIRQLMDRLAEIPAADKVISPIETVTQTEATSDVAQRLYPSA